MEYFTELSLILIGILLSTNADSFKINVFIKLASYKSSVLGFRTKVRTGGLSVTETVGL